MPCCSAVKRIYTCPIDYTFSTTHKSASKSQTKHTPTKNRTIPETHTKKLINATKPIQKKDALDILGVDETRDIKYNC
jgi:hypothetical protein